MDAKPGRYWDFERAEWARYPAAPPKVVVPEQERGEADEPAMDARAGSGAEQGRG